MLVVHLLKTNKELKNLWRLKIQTWFTKMILIKHVLAKELARRTESDKVLNDKAFKIASNPKYDGYQTGLASMVYKFFDKKSSRSGVATLPIYQLANEWLLQNLREEMQSGSKKNQQKQKPKKPQRS